MSEKKVGERDIMRGLRGASGHEVTLGGVRAKLRTLGLYIVDAKSKAVLDAMGYVSTVDLEWVDHVDSQCSDTLRELSRAELARREAK